MRPQREDPGLRPEVGHVVLLVASGRDSQGLVLVHLKLVQVSWGHLGKPDRGGVVEDGAHDGL